MDNVTDGVLLLLLADPGNDAFGSNGVLKLAPLTPKASNPLYSPPYCVLAQPEMDSVIVSDESALLLFAQNSAI